MHLMRRHWAVRVFAWTATRSRNSETRRGIIESICDNLLVRGAYADGDLSDSSWAEEE